MFEEAARLKFRFPSTKGDLTVEQLWDLPLTSLQGLSLDKMAKGIARMLRETEEESFVDEESPAASFYRKKLDILKHIIEVKKKENKERQDALLRKQQVNMIDEILEKKKEMDLMSKPLEELQKLRDSL